MRSHAGRVPALLLSVCIILAPSLGSSLREMQSRVEAADAVLYTPPHNKISNVFVGWHGQRGGGQGVAARHSTLSTNTSLLNRTQTARHHVFFHQNKCGGTATKRVIRAKKNLLPPINHAQATAVSACNPWVFKPGKYNEPWIVGGYANGVCDLLDREEGGRGEGSSCHYFTMFRNPLFRLVSAFKFCNYHNSNNRWRTDQLCDAESSWTETLASAKDVRSRFRVFVNRWSDFSVSQLAHSLGDCDGMCDGQVTTCWPEKMRSMGRPDLRSGSLPFSSATSDDAEARFGAELRHPHPNNSIVEVPPLRTARRIAADLQNRFSVIGLQRHFSLSMFLVGFTTGDEDFVRAALDPGYRNKKPRTRLTDETTIELLQEVCSSPDLTSFIRHDFLVYSRAVQLFVRQLESPVFWQQTQLSADDFDAVTEGVVKWNEETNQTVIIDAQLRAVSAIAKGLRYLGESPTKVDEAIAQLLFDHTCSDLGPRKCHATSAHRTFKNVSTTEECIALARDAGFAFASFGALSRQCILCAGGETASTSPKHQLHLVMKAPQNDAPWQLLFTEPLYQLMSASVETHPLYHDFAQERDVVTHIRRHWAKQQNATNGEPSRAAKKRPIRPKKAKRRVKYQKANVEASSANPSPRMQNDSVKPPKFSGRERKGQQARGYPRSASRSKRPTASSRGKKHHKKGQHSDL